MTQRKGEKPTISIQEHMAIDVCPGPIQPIKQISDYFPRYPRGLPPTAPQPAGHAGPLRSALSTPAAAAATSESDRPNEDSPERACAGASASLQAVRRDEEPDVEGYDSDDSSECFISYCISFSATSCQASLQSDFISNLLFFLSLYLQSSDSNMNVVSLRRR
ncbi:double C2-like domain-containing protein beta [Poecilia formosa]|uniref:double C2-like domain-containing protein beta n=1 Tax=Poecilia formosa TaxID=48698 RepID=UPI0007BA63F0|nr:PREDICTED: double C2-like domain-containing protein beta [Poecilia formosa]